MYERLSIHGGQVPSFCDVPTRITHRREIIGHERGCFAMTSEAISYFPDALVPPQEIPLPDASQAARSGEFSIRSNTAPLEAEISDEELLQQIAQGQKDAIGVLFRRNARSTWAVAHRILRNEAEADDLVQDLFIFLYRKASIFDPSKCSARSWIIQMAYQRAFDRRRNLMARRFYTAVSTSDMEEILLDSRRTMPFHACTLEGVLGKDGVRQFERMLSPEQQRTIRMHFFEGFTLEEIAEQFSQPLSNVRNHYYRGLDRLRKYVVKTKTRSK